MSDPDDDEDRASTELAVVTGLDFEAKILTRAFQGAHLADIALMTATGLGEAAREVAEALIAERPTVVASFGVCGGLRPGLKPGTIVIADAVVRQGKPRLAATSRLVARMQLAASDAVVGTIACVERPAATVAAKAELARTLRAIAVDMESYIIAEAAAAANLPFVAVRVVADPAERDIPPAALAGGGGVNVSAVLGALVRSPGQLGGLLRLARDMAAARKGLEKGALLLLR